MRKTITIVILILLSAILIGCSSTTSDSSEESTGEIEEPVANVTGGDQIEGTWKTDYNGSTVILAINNDGTYEFYQSKKKYKVLISGTYTNANDTLTLTQDELVESGDGEGDFITTTTIPYTLEGNELHTSINNQTITFNRV